MDDIGPRDMNVLVTGGGGFIGSHLVEALAPDNEVVVLDDFSNGNPDRVPDNAEVVRGDIRDSTTLTRAVADVDVIFHEAAIVSVEQSVDAPETTHAVNVDATLSLLSAAREAGARVVFASSAAIYGTPDAVPVFEDDRKEPTSPYGLEKYAADQYCRLFTELYDLETVCLRYFNVYGPHQSSGPYSGVLTKFVEQARDGGPITIQGDGGQTRDFVHVDDVVQANLRAATTDHVGEAFNVGTGRTTSIRQLAESVRDALDPAVEIQNVPGRPGDIRHSQADVSKARRLLGYEPTVSLSEGIPTVTGSGSDREQ